MNYGLPEDERKEIRQKLLEEYDWNNIAEKTAKLYCELMENDG